MSKEPHALRIPRKQLLSSCTHVQIMQPHNCTPIAETYNDLYTGTGYGVYLLLAQMFLARSLELPDAITGPLS